MKYQEYAPTSKLKAVVDSYWLYTDLKKVENERILPDGSMDIIFNLGSSGSSIPQNTIVISGMMTKFSDKLFNKGSELLGIRFKSGKLSNLTSFPLFEIKNKIVTASEIIPQFTTEKLEQLKEQKNIEQKINFIEQTINNTLKNELNDTLIFSVIDFILNASEPVNIKKMAKEHLISLRQLERKFKHKAGVTLKEYCRIIRFTKTKKHLKNKLNESLLHIACDNGYYDHSHLTNEFKRFSGDAPSCFR